MFCAYMNVIGAIPVEEITIATKRLVYLVVTFSEFLLLEVHNSCAQSIFATEMSIKYVFSVLFSVSMTSSVICDV